MEVGLYGLDRPGVTLRFLTRLHQSSGHAVHQVAHARDRRFAVEFIRDFAYHDLHGLRGAAW